MEKINKEIEKQRNNLLEEDRKSDEERRKKYSLSCESFEGSALEEKMSPSCGVEYKEWLKLAISKGIKATHVYDYPTSRWDWCVAIEDFYLQPLYGAGSVSIIVPKGIKCLGGEAGHNKIFFMDIDNNKISNLIPIFDDI